MRAEKPIASVGIRIVILGAAAVRIWQCTTRVHCSDIGNDGKLNIKGEIIGKGGGDIHLRIYISRRLLGKLRNQCRYLGYNDVYTRALGATPSLHV